MLRRHHPFSHWGTSQYSSEGDTGSFWRGGSDIFSHRCDHTHGGYNRYNHIGRYDANRTLLAQARPLGSNSCCFQYSHLVSLHVDVVPLSSSSLDHYQAARTTSSTRTGATTPTVGQLDNHIGPSSTDTQRSSPRPRAPRSHPHPTRRRSKGRGAASRRKEKRWVAKANSLSLLYFFTIQLFYL